ncbi:MAG: hypothetical protein JWN99_956 [Ilumatobacteraceae bacterium]|nr:hypothetical protein [Ilumatobacteraceae bacterium]
MKQYLMSVFHVEGEVMPTGDAMQAMFDAVDEFNNGLQATGAWVFAGGLFPPDVSTVVQVKDGNTVTTDGPFAESKEHMGGFWIIKAPDLDAALKLAADGSKACGAPVEVRPFQEDPAS